MLINSLIFKNNDLQICNDLTKKWNEILKKNKNIINNLDINYITFINHKIENDESKRNDRYKFDPDMLTEYRLKAILIEELKDLFQEQNQHFQQLSSVLFEKSRYQLFCQFRRGQFTPIEKIEYGRCYPILNYGNPIKLTLTQLLDSFISKCEYNLFEELPTLSINYLRSVRPLLSVEDCLNDFLFDKIVTNKHCIPDLIVMTKQELNNKFNKNLNELQNLHKIVIDNKIIYDDLSNRTLTILNTYKEELEEALNVYHTETETSNKRHQGDIRSVFSTEIRKQYYSALRIVNHYKLLFQDIGTNELTTANIETFCFRTKFPLTDFVKNFCEQEFDLTNFILLIYNDQKNKLKYLENMYYSQYDLIQTRIRRKMFLEDETRQLIKKIITFDQIEITSSTISKVVQSIESKFQTIEPNLIWFWFDLIEYNSTIIDWTQKSLKENLIREFKTNKPIIQWAYLFAVYLTQLYLKKSVTVQFKSYRP